LLALPWFMAAQSPPQFQAIAESDKVLLNDFFQVHFSLKNGQGSNFRAPAFQGFKVVAGPSRRTSTTIVNGKVSTETGFSYSLQALKEGRFTIGTASIRVEGKELKTRPLKIQVVKGKTGLEKNEAQSFFVRAVPNVTETVIGQQVVLEYRLYTTVDVKSYNVLSEPDYQGFFATEITGAYRYGKREIIDGINYYTQVIKRMALFPQQAGQLNISSMSLQLSVVTRDPNNNSFFFGRRTQRVSAITEPISINVKPLPADQPDSFTGAVGNYRIHIAVNSTNITTDDVLNVRLSISGNGDIKRVQPPELQFPEAFEAYDPNILEESSFELNGTLSGKKEIEYLLVPRESGRYEIKPAFSYYDPDSAKYITVERRFNLMVSQGSQNLNDRISEEKPEEGLKDIHYIKTSSRFKSKDSYFLGSVFFCLLVALPMLVLIGALILKRLQRKRANMDPALLKSKRARKLAEKRLEAARSFLD